MTTTTGGTVGDPADARAIPDEHPAAQLRTVAVEYEHRLNRCTVRPRSMRRDERTTAWLTADAAAFNALAALR